jgi:hypothetical protein
MRIVFIFQEYKRSLADGFSLKLGFSVLADRGEQRSPGAGTHR